MRRVKMVKSGRFVRAIRESRSRLLARSFGFSTFFCVISSSMPARAFERQWHAGAGAGVALLGDSGPGPAIGAHVAYGISDLFDWNTEALGSHHFEGEGANVLSLATGLSYKIDVFQWIPYVGLLGGVYVFGGEPGPNGEKGIEPGGSIFAGLDYLMSRSTAVGLQVRQHATLADGVGLPYFNATLRFEYRWGF